MLKVLLPFLLLLSVFTSLHGQDCQIASITATPQDCDGHSFMVSIDLVVNDPSAASFTLAGNGIIYGTYLYDQLPVTIGPFLGDNETELNFIAWDIENSACQNFTTLLSPDCGPICGFSNASLTLVECVSLVSALVEFDVDYHNPENVAFDLFYENGSQAGSWLYTSLPITINFFQVSGAAPIVLTICDNDNTSCCETFSFAPIDCNPNNCEIVNLSAVPDCIGNNFIVHLDFDHAGTPSDSFNVHGNSINYGHFAYSDLPIVLGPLNGNTNLNWEFAVNDLQNGNCQNIYNLGQYHCPPPCHVETLGASVLECTSDSTYALQLGVEIEGEGGNGYAVFNDHTYFGSFSYDDLPQIISDLQGSGDLVDEITICDNENPGCCSTTLYEAFLCAGCVIENLTAVAQPCDSSGQFMVELDFYHYNVSGDGFDVTGNGSNYGQFAYEDLPVLLGPFNGDGSTFLEFVVSDLVDPLCFDAVELGEIDCSQICELSNLTVETGECTGDDTYHAVISFDYQGVTGIGFDLYVNGVFYDFFSYNDLPLTLDEFPSNGTGTDMIMVCENDNANCCTSLEFPAPDCSCQLFEATVDVLNCTSDSTFAISLEFFSENTPNQNVDIYLDGVYFGFYSAANLPLILNNIPESEDEIQLTVCASDQNDCCANVIFQGQMCEAPQCNIWDLFAEHGDCNSDSTYVLEFSFNHSNLASDSIIVMANDSLIGQFLIDPDFNRIEHFPVLESDTVNLVICNVGAPDCCDNYTFVAPDCSDFNACHIWDLEAEPDMCQTDSTYILHVTFHYINLPSDFVDITIDTTYIGSSLLHGGVLTLENIPVSPGQHTTLVICAQGGTACCDTVVYETPNCGGNYPCNIWDLVGVVQDCQTDSTYVLHIEFNYDNLPTDSVHITANGNFIGDFQVHEGNIVMENIPVYETDHTTVTVCALGNEDCCDSFEYETPHCLGANDCNIWDLVGIVQDCQTDTTYILHIEFNYDNLPTDSVHITANGQFIGDYQVHEGNIFLEHFPVFETNHTTITVCALGNEECCNSFEFETPNCEGVNDCHIWDLVADPGVCEGDTAFSLLIHYNSANFPGDSIVATANETLIGHFVHQPDGFTIEHFPAFAANHTTIHVCALDAPDCCDSYTFETPDCGQGVGCHFDAIFAEHGDCTSDSTFLVDIVLELHNANTDSVLIYTNDSLVGQFEVQPDFIRIENFPRLPDEHAVTITVCAVGHPDCCASYILEQPFCSDDCVIYDINVQALNCTSDTTFTAVISWQYQNISAGGFDVYAGDQYLGFFTFDQIPVETHVFPANESGHYSVTVCESDSEECCDTREFEGPSCGLACHIYDLVYTMTDCDSTGHFYFILDFDYDHVGFDGFDILGNGNNYGNFNYEDLPIQLGPFEADGTVWEFVVHDDAYPPCSDAVEPGVVTCEVDVTPVLPDDYYTILSNGTHPGILAKKDLLFSLYNANGHVLLRNQSLNAHEHYDLGSLPAGLYLMTVQHESHVWPIKLVRTDR